MYYLRPCTAAAELHSVHVYLLFFKHTAPTEIYTLSLHDALPIYIGYIYIAQPPLFRVSKGKEEFYAYDEKERDGYVKRSEEHTSELQSPYDLVCRLLLEKKNKNRKQTTPTSAALRRPVRSYASSA